MNFTKISNIWLLGLFLAVFCGISGVAMAFFAVKTAEPIRLKKQANIQKSMAAILPEFDNIPVENTVIVKSGDGFELKFHGAFLKGKLVGLAVETSSKMGYSGEVAGVVSLTPEGLVRSIAVTGHSETPGLGSVICDRKAEKTIFNLFDGSKKDEKLPPNRFLDWYGGKAMPSEGWKITKDGGEAEYMTGATITCRAVADLANRAVRTFNADRQRIIDGVHSNEEGKK
jgi:electron transport complex protein RnfG